MQYNDEDLNAAVAAGIVPGPVAARFRSFAATRQGGGAVPADGSPLSVDEEHFKLLTGFNDIFVSIAAVLLLLAVGWLGNQLADPLGGVFLAATAWGLAEHFTRRRRMALPSIVLLLAFVIGTGGAVMGFAAGLPWFDSGREHLAGGLATLAAAGAAWAHWRRFMVPITVAAGVGTLAASAILLLIWQVPVLLQYVTGLMILTGLGVFALAMRWDSQDLTRTTRRSDVAFWLHLLAAPMIIHPVFTSLGVFSAGGVDVSGALIAVAVYLALGLLSLAIDRRAMLVSALAYVLYAIGALFGSSGGSSDANLPLAGLVIGSALLLLSAAWHPTRRRLLTLLPADVRTWLPAG